MLAGLVRLDKAIESIPRKTPTDARVGKPEISRMVSDETAPPAPPSRPPKLLECMRIHLRTRHYSIRTKEAYIDWARRFILFHHKRHPCEMGAEEVEAFLRHLAVDRQVAASTQNQAKSAILYLYKQALGMELPWLNEMIQARRPRRLPVVLTPSQVRELLMHMEGTARLIAQLLGGKGMGWMGDGLMAPDPRIHVRRCPQASKGAGKAERPVPAIWNKKRPQRIRSGR